MHLSGLVYPGLTALSASPTYLAVHLSGLVYPGLTDSLVSLECHTHLPSSASIWSSLPWADWLSSQPWVPHPLTQQCIYLVQFTLGWLTLWSALSATPTYPAVQLSGLVYPGLTLWSAPSATPTLLSNQPHPLTQQCIYLVQFTLGWLTLWSALSASPTYLAVHLSGLVYPGLTDSLVSLSATPTYLAVHLSGPVYPGLTDSLVSPECHTHLPSSASIWSSLPWADPLVSPECLTHLPSSASIWSSLPWADPLVSPECLTHLPSSASIWSSLPWADWLSGQPWVPHPLTQ